MIEAYMINERTITVYYDGQVYVANKADVNDEAIQDLLEEGWYDDAIELMDITQSINAAADGIVTILDGIVYINGAAIHNAITRRIIELHSNGKPFDRVAKFLVNMEANPSYRSREQTYNFLESNSLPITEDGNFLAYKNVNANYRDKHSGTFDNSVGAVCKEDRRLVDDDPNRTCSKGLHVCSMEYLKGFWGTSGHTMIVEVNPRDVVAVPTEYKNSKMRVCEYTVVSEHSGNTEDHVETHNYDNFYNKRDSLGRFVR